MSPVEVFDSDEYGEYEITTQDIHTYFKDEPMYSQFAPQYWEGMKYETLEPIISVSSEETDTPPKPKGKRVLGRCLRSPYTNPLNRLRGKSSMTASPLCEGIKEDIINELVTWIYQEDDQEPKFIDVREGRLAREFMRVLITPDQWLTDLHLNNISYLIRTWLRRLEKTRQVKAIVIGSDFVVILLARGIKNKEQLLHWEDDRFLVPFVQGAHSSSLLDWRLLDKVYFLLMNAKRDYWFLAEADLKNKLIRTFDSMGGRRLKESATEKAVSDLSINLPFLLRAVYMKDKQA